MLLGEVAGAGLHAVGRPSERIFCRRDNLGVIETGLLEVDEFAFDSE
jgi:hypothetical protein